MGEALDGVTRIHIVGIGGAGMSGLARLLAGRGYVVSGSDAAPSATLGALTAAGVTAWHGHDPARIGAADLVVASSAVPADDPELQSAAAAGTVVWRRPQLLAAITATIPTIGATGTHGKTSSTAMLVEGARAAGLDPAFVVGGELLGIGTNAASGADDLLVLEVDEAFGTFEHVRLTGLMVTNIEADHLDHFGTYDGVEAAFERVVRAVRGPVLACIDDPGAARLVERTDAVGYGTDATATWRIERPVLRTDGASFVLVGPEQRLEIDVPRPGLHMVRNAAGALALLAAVGVDIEAAAEGLRTFGGVGRRWEHRGDVGDVTIYDDYAHHPTEVTATMAAAQRSGRRVVAVFQPHLYSRTVELADDFGAALAGAAVVVVLDVYGSREAPVPGVDGRLVSAAARRAGVPTVLDAPVRSEAAQVVASVVQPGDMVVCMGAGDVGELPAELLDLLRAGE